MTFLSGSCRVADVFFFEEVANDARLILAASEVCSGVRHHVRLFAGPLDLKKGRRAKAAESAKDARIAKLEAVVSQKEAKIAQKNEVFPSSWRRTSSHKKPVEALKGHLSEWPGHR